MQTFLPYPKFDETSRVLDYRRLGKQRVEARQILKALRTGGGWSNHPATKMWRGYEDALILYSNIMIAEWIARGYNNTMEMLPVSNYYKLPPWIGNADFHASHRSMLLKKDFEFYSQWNWSEEPGLEYVWPVR